MAGYEIANAYVALYTRMPGVQKDIEDSVGDAGEKAGEKVGDGLGKGITNKQAALTGAVGGIFASLASSAASAITDRIAEAVTQSDATDKFSKSLEFAGLDTSAIDATTTAARKYADATVYDLSTIQNTVASLAANGISNYSELTEAAGNLNAVAGGNADTFSSVAMMLGQTAGAGKLTTENWNQLADAIPTGSGELQKALEKAGAYTGNFRDAMAEGQITADEFNDALLNVGTRPVAVEAATSVTTMEGAVGNLQAAITGVLADAFTTIKPLITGFTNAIAWFVSNSGLLVPVLTGIATALIVAFAPAIWAAVAAVGAFTVALLTNPLTWVIVGITALVAAVIWMAQNWDTVVKWITDVWGGFISWITGVLDGFVSWWNDLWAGVGRWISDVWNGFINGIVGMWNGFWTWVTTAIGNFGRWIGDTWNGIWTGLGNIVKDVWNGILGIIEGGVNAAIDLVNGFTGGIRDVAGAVFGVEIGAIPHVRIPRLGDGATVLPRAGGTLAVLAERGRPESVVDTGLMNQALEQGLSGSGLREGDRLTLVVEGTPLTAVVRRQIGAYDQSQQQKAARGYRGGF